MLNETKEDIFAEFYSRSKKDHQKEKMKALLENFRMRADSAASSTFEMIINNCCSDCADIAESAFQEACHEYSSRLIAICESLKSDLEED